MWYWHTERYIDQHNEIKSPEINPDTYIKINSKLINNQNIRAIKILEENIGINLHDLGFDEGFLDITLKAQAMK